MGKGILYRSSTIERKAHPAATTAIINRIRFMPATLRLTGSGVNAVGGEEAWGNFSQPRFARLEGLRFKH
jgi:hypothetical protein